MRTNGRLRKPSSYLRMDMLYVGHAKAPYPTGWHI